MFKVNNKNTRTTLVGDLAGPVKSFTFSVFLSFYLAFTFHACCKMAKNTLSMFGQFTLCMKGLTIWCFYLAHFIALFSFNTPWKLQKTTGNLRFSNVTRGYRNWQVVWSGLMTKFLSSIDADVSYCVKSVRFRSFSGPCSVRMLEHTDQKTPNTDTFHAVPKTVKKCFKFWWPLLLPNHLNFFISFFLFLVP